MLRLIAAALFVHGIADDSLHQHVAPSLARAEWRHTGSFLEQRVAAAPAPVAAAVPSPALVVSASPVAAAPPPENPCVGVCNQAKEMWKEAADAREFAIEQDVKQTESAINAETSKLVDQVKMELTQKGMTDFQVLQQETEAYLAGRVSAFNTALAKRHDAMIRAKATQFNAVKEHQGALMDALMADVVSHSYQVAKETTEHEAQTAGTNIQANPAFNHALKSIEKADLKWTQTYQATNMAARRGFAAWTGAYHGLNGPWKNITSSFDKANTAAEAASGLGSDTRWAREVVRVSGDVVQAAQSEAQKQASSADLTMEMATGAANLVKANSGNIVILNELLDKASANANAAQAVR